MLVVDRHRARASAPPAAAARRRAEPARRPASARSRLFVVLRAFSSGCDRAHRRGGDRERRQRLPPSAGEERGARRSACSASIAITIFLGVSYLAVHMHARPSATDSVVSQIARAVFPAGSPGGFMYYVVQATTLARPHPRREHVVPGLPAARRRCSRATGSSPRQFTNLGDRLVFSNGMLVLAARRRCCSWIYNANIEQPHPPVRHRRLHGLHALAGRDGALLAARRATPGWQWKRDRERRRRVARPASSR